MQGDGNSRGLSIAGKAISNIGAPVDPLQPTPTTMAGRFPSPSPLLTGWPGLFFQTGSDLADLHAAGSLVRDEGMGIVFTMSSKVTHTVARLGQLAAEYRGAIGPLGHVLVDINRYSGKKRRVATRLDPGWIKAQRAAGLKVVLTDSPYLPSGDRATLISILTQARGLGPDVIVVLPLHLHWLTKPADRAALIDAINTAGIPVVLVLEHANDPLGIHAAVAGLVQLLREVQVQVGLLRCDLSVIGAVAFGAMLGAVGASTGLRHLYPAASGGGGHEPSIAAFVPRTMAYRSLQKINAGIAADPDNQERWRCECRFCYDRMLSYIVDETRAYQHSLASIAVLGQEVLSAKTQEQRQLAWVSACQLAQTVNLEIESDTGLNWEPPAFQGAWRKLASQLPGPRTSPA